MRRFLRWCFAVAAVVNGSFDHLVFQTAVHQRAVEFGETVTAEVYSQKFLASGSCQTQELIYDPPSSSRGLYYYAGVSAGRSACGRCIRVSCDDPAECDGKYKSITAVVLDECTNCNSTDIRLSSHTVVSLTGKNESISAKWEFIECPADIVRGNVGGCVFPINNSTEVFQPINLAKPLDQMIMNGKVLDKAEDAFGFPLQGFKTKQPVTVRLKAMDGQIIDQTFTFGSNHECQPGTKQFSSTADTASSVSWMIVPAILLFVAFVSAVAFFYFRKRSHASHHEDRNGDSAWVTESPAPKSATDSCVMLGSTPLSHHFGLSESSSVQYSIDISPSRGGSEKRGSENSSKRMGNGYSGFSLGSSNLYPATEESEASGDTSYDSYGSDSLLQPSETSTIFSHSNSMTETKSVDSYQTGVYSATSHIPTTHGDVSSEIGSDFDSTQVFPDDEMDKRKSF